ncbi:MAG TPA: AMP-binding protein, partial [Rhodocyclaceae bacterium]|nr:AMP-binding protein [Rhodocyclaceae bacterium]
MSSPYASGLAKNVANYTPLTPLSFIERSAHVHPGRCAVIHGARRYTWKETYARSRRLASALTSSGINAGDTVAVMLNNTPEMIECHFGVPMTGAVLNTLNTRLDAESIAFMLDHGEARALIADREYAAVVEPALARLDREILLIEVDDSEYTGPGSRIGDTEYEAYLAGGDPDHAWRNPEDEWNAIALNYTSGTTGNPKGVVYHHRGAYLNAVSNIVSWGMPPAAVYLWTLPMFHCNGWCFPWTLAAISGTNVCLRRVDPKLILDAIRVHRVTHYCG